MKKIKLIMVLCSIFSCLSLFAQKDYKEQLLLCNAIDARGTIFQEGGEQIEANCLINFHYNLKSPLIPEGGWYLRLYCQQLGLDEIEQCGVSNVTINKESNEMSAELGKPIEITIGPNNIASLTFVPSKINTYPMFIISISNHNYAIAIKECNFIRIANQKREKLEIEYTKSTLSNILDTWFSIVSLK